MPQVDDTEHPLDMTAVAMIVALVIVIGPATIVASVLVLTHGFDLAATTRFEGIAALIVSALALVMIRAGARELSGAIGVRVDARGVHRGRLSIAWAEVERIESAGFGTLAIIAGGSSVRIQAYLFREPKRLLDTITVHTGIAIPV